MHIQHAKKQKHIYLNICIEPDTFKAQEERLAREEELRQQLEAGEITEAEYNTLSTSTSSGATAPALEIPNLAPTYHIDESAITDSLTEEDIQYLMLK